MTFHLMWLHTHHTEQSTVQSHMARGRKLVCEHSWDDDPVLSGPLLARAPVLCSSCGESLLLGGQLGSTSGCSCLSDVCRRERVSTRRVGLLAARVLPLKGFTHPGPLLLSCSAGFRFWVSPACPALGSDLALQQLSWLLALLLDTSDFISSRSTRPPVSHRLISSKSSGLWMLSTFISGVLCTHEFSPSVGKIPRSIIAGFYGSSAFSFVESCLVTCLAVQFCIFNSSESSCCSSSWPVFGVQV